jgi:Ca2+-binding EF-hand superfamily protein
MNNTNTNYSTSSTYQASQSDLLISLFTSIVSYEKDLLIQRNKLNQNFCFDSPFGYFSSLDTTKKNYLNYIDLNEFLSTFPYTFSSQHLKQVIKFYDRDRDHSWNFDEYLGFTQINKNNHEFNYNSHFIKAKETDDSISKYRQELFNLFKLNFDMITFTGIKIRNIKLNNNNNFDTKALFDEIKGENNTNIDTYNLFMYLNSKIRNITLEDVKLIVDKFGNKGVITLKQFEDLFSFDKFVKDSDVKYVKTKGYYKTNIVDHSKKLYYTDFTRQCFNRFNDAYGDNNNSNEMKIKTNLTMTQTNLPASNVQHKESQYKSSITYNNKQPQQQRLTYSINSNGDISFK